jgi:hypothetical protein
MSAGKKRNMVGAGVFLVLLLLYALLPFFLGAGASIGLRPQEVTGVRLEFADGDGGWSVERTAGGDEWVLAEGRAKGAPADPLILGRLVAGLSQASFDAGSGSVPADAPVMTLSADGRETVIRLGEPVQAFRNRVVEINGRTGTLDFDLGACVGLWPGRESVGPDTIVNRSPLIRYEDRITAVRIRNLFAEYAFNRTELEITPAGEEVAAMIRSEWEAVLPEGEIAAAPVLQRYTNNLARLTVDGVVTDLDPGTLQFPVALEFTTDDGKDWTLKAAPMGEGPHLVWLTGPESTALYTVPSGVLTDLFVGGSRLYAGEWVAETASMEAVQITIERGRARIVLEKQDEKTFRMAAPPLNLKLDAPGAVAPGMVSGDNGVQYAHGIMRLVWSDRLDPERPGVREMIAAVQEAPYGRVTLEFRGRKPVVIRVGAPIPAMDSCVVTIGDQAGVVRTATAEVVLRDLPFFFREDQLEGEVLPW